MRLEEIKEGNAAEKRVQILKANAKAAEERARQMKASADLNAERLQLKQSRQQSAQIQRSKAGTTIKSHC